MKRRAACASLFALVAATGCATDWRRSYDRWRGYEERSNPYSSWAHCINDRSTRYLDLEAAPAGADIPQGTRSQVFTYVLADCREHMSGAAWEYLNDGQVQRLIGDAWRAFNGVAARIQADRTAEVI